METKSNEIPLTWDFNGTIDWETLVLKNHLIHEV